MAQITPSSIVNTVQDLKRISTEKGLQFRVINHPQEAIKHNLNNKLVMYLSTKHVSIEMRQFIHGGLYEQCDGVLFHKQLNIDVSFGLMTKSAIRKWLDSDPSKQSCDTCNKKTEFGKCASCSSCSTRFCILCLIKMALTPQNIQEIYQMNAALAFECPQCQDLTGIDILETYYKVENQLDELSQSQRDVLSFLKKTDPCRK
eukprot:244741_1